VIPMHWDDAKQTLTIGERTGKFPGMLETRTFRVVLVSENHGAGITAGEPVDKVISYGGKLITFTP
jgi:alpha-D-xyloside xylohydrolase